MANDKAELAIAFKLAGVPHPDTHVVHDVAEATAAGAEYGFPVILKTPFDSGSKGVWKVEDPAELERLVAARLGEGHSRLVVQRFHPEATGHDRRVLVMRRPDGEYEVFAAYHRRANGDDFRANGGVRGNRYERIAPDGSSPDLTPEEIAIAKRAAAATGVDYAGVDLMHTNKGTMVIEINPTPGTPELDVALPRSEHAMPRLARWALTGLRPLGGAGSA